MPSGGVMLRPAVISRRCARLRHQQPDEAMTASLAKLVRRIGGIIIKMINVLVHQINTVLGLSLAGPPALMLAYHAL